MRSIPTDLPQGQDRQHRTIIANATNDLLKVRPPHDRTEAEVNAGITPVNYAYPPGNLRRYGGAPGSQDNTAAMDAAEAVCAEQDGGVITIDTPGEWRMNWVCTTNGVVLQGPNGSAEFDVACIRPYSLASAPITIGDGTAVVRYVRIRALHISGTDDVGGTNFNDPAHSAPQTFLIGGAVNLVVENCVLYNGIHTISVQPSLTVPATDIAFVNCKMRNDLVGETDARLVYAKRLVETSGGGYITDLNFVRCKGNGPKDGYLFEFDGTDVGFAPIFIGGYYDTTPGRGILVKGSAGIRMFACDIDPGANGVVIFETDEAQADPTRFLFGYMTQGGQRIQFSGTTLDSGTLQGATSNTATIRAAASFADNALAGQVLRILTGTGAGYQYQIASNVGATDVVTISGTFTVTPDSSSTYDIVPTVLLPAEADWFLYRPRIFRAFFGATNYVSTAADPYNTTVSWDLGSSTGPLTLSGAQLRLTNGIRIEGTDLFREIYESDAGTNAKLWWERVNSGVYKIQTMTDAGGAGKDAFIIGRVTNSTAIEVIELGNSTDLQRNTFHGHIAITDGVAAPSATSGLAKIYVDTSDGDLKVVFGDGTVKTIMTDT